MTESIPLLLKEMDQEATTTRKMLAIVPDDQYDYRPHPKSMNIRSLATHIAELPSWVNLALDTDELDFATSPYNPVLINDTMSLLDYLEKNYSEARARLAQAKDDDLLPPWVLREGDQVYVNATKGEMIRISLSQTIHHRAQLGVFLRLLNIPIPGSYGPSADESF